MFNLKNIFNENSENRNSKNNSNNFLGDGKAILDAVDDGVLAVDSKGNILAINPAAEQITGWNGSDAVGLVFNSVLKITNNDGDEMINISNPVTRVLQTGDNFTTRDLFAKTPSGKVVPIFLAVNSIDNHGSGAVVVFRDISKELKENRDQAEFISTASHEMRTPVASIEGYLGLALNPATATIDARAKSYLEKAHENTKHLGQLFQDLLDITKAEDGRLKNEPVVLDAIEFSRNIWEGLKPKAEDKGLEYIFEPDNHKTGEKTITPVFFIHADRDHLHEVLNNLFENAIKYTPSGRVSVNVTGENDTVKISVTDSGIGIPAEDMPHLFQKFYRVDNSETREINGTGLGLFLSRKLTESIGGNLTVESEYKKGSTFTVKLPRITRENAETLKLKEEEKKTEEHQKIEQQRNQREIDEADRDIAAILEDTKSENSSEEIFEMAKEIQPETPTIPESIPQNINQTNIQIQPPIQQNIPTQTQPQIQQPTQQIQTAQPIPVQQQTQIFRQPAPVQSTTTQPQTIQQTPQPQKSDEMAALEEAQNMLRKLQTQQQTPPQNTVVMHGAVSGFNPNLQRQNIQATPQQPQYQQQIQNQNIQQTVQQSITQAQPQVQNMAQNQQTVQNIYSAQYNTTQQTPQNPVQNTFTPPAPAPIPTPQIGQLPPNPPTLNDIERMKIEYAQRMMIQKK